MNMKKFISVLMAGAMAVSMVACGEKETVETPVDQTPVSTEVAVADYVGEYALPDGSILTIAEDSTFEVVNTVEVLSDDVVVSETETSGESSDILLIAEPTTGESVTTTVEETEVVEEAETTEEAEIISATVYPATIPEGKGTVSFVETDGVITGTFAYDDGEPLVTTAVTETTFEFVIGEETVVATKIIEVDETATETTEETVEEVTDETTTAEEVVEKTTEEA